MKKLSPEELSALGVMLERAIKHEQLCLSVCVTDKKTHGVIPTTSFGTTDLLGTCDSEDCIELLAAPSALKWLWVRYTGYLGGAKKAANAKQRKTR
jgi:hypothetical protein